MKPSWGEAVLYGFMYMLIIASVIVIVDYSGGGEMPWYVGAAAGVLGTAIYHAWWHSVRRG